MWYLMYYENFMNQMKIKNENQTDAPHPFVG